MVYRPSLRFSSSSTKINGILVFVSSAKDVTLECLIYAFISPVTIRNNIGPRTEPCGTPLITVDSLE